MADVKLSQLNSILNSELAGDDLILITDTSAGESKSLSISEFDQRIGAARVVNTYTTNQILSSSNDIVIGNTASGVITFTLPSPSANNGLELHICKISGATDFNSITISGTGLSYKLFGAGESVRIVSNGTNWLIIDTTKSETMSYVPGLSGASNIATNVCYVSFDRGIMDATGQMSFSGTAGAATPVILDIPAGLTINTALLPGGTSTTNALASIITETCIWYKPTLGWEPLHGHYASSTTINFRSAGAVFNWSSLLINSALNYQYEVPVN